MAMTINQSSNSPGMRSHLNKTQRNMRNTLAKLTTGLKINSAKDNAAGLAISDRMRSQIRGLNQAMRNANDGISLLQTAEGGLSQSTEILQRMRELAVQSSNGTYNTDDRASLNAEFSQLQSELDRIAETTEFNGQPVLDGRLSATGMNFQVGPNADDGLNVTIGGATQAALGTDTLDVATAANAQDTLMAIDAAIGRLGSLRGEMGATQNRFESTITNLGNVSENIAAANSRILDTDFVLEAAALTRDKILGQASVAVQAQANLSARTALSLLG